jgi:asparagine synthase (glutamine-hydrolysing)
MQMVRSTHLCTLRLRVPFLDNDLVDFAQRLPVEYKVAREAGSKVNENETASKPLQIEQRRTDGKRILREALDRKVAPGLIGREKQGFSAPDASWFRGESIEYVERTLMRDQAHLYEFLDRETVHSVVSDHLSGRRNRRLLIWSLLSLEQWAQLYLG